MFPYVFRIFLEGKRPRGTYECPDSQGGWNGPEWLNLGASNFDSTFQSTDVLGATSNIFLFTPKIGEMIQLDDHIFGMG